ncbi:MAG: prepilin-type N-terminal cleavage/methylation domain-containing protein [Planctomycetes bacterium]|nr:prepilin-type N-terminal cleavage/methylation domain-containing protein [Planctomycetota bacterium]
MSAFGDCPRQARAGLWALRVEAGAPHGCRGFTLVELVLSMAIMTILMTGLASAILIASHALPTDDSPARAVVESAQVVDVLAEDLRSALWIRERTATSVEFAVPDRDADGAAERIRYAWSDTAGDPLTRQYNGGSVVEVLQNVQELDLTYELKAVTEEYPGVPVESAEALLKSYNNSVSMFDAHVHNDLWWAEYFEPSLPGDTVRWSVTRVLFVAKRDHDDDTTTRIQLRLPNADGTPSDTVVDEVAMPQLSLTDVYQWIEKSFADASGLSASQGLCLAFITNDSNSAKLWIEDKDVFLPNAGLIEGVPAWKSIDTSRALRFYVYGAVFTPGPAQTATRQYVTGVGIALRAGDESTSRIVTAVQTLNTPELLSGWWEADFETDPTLDRNGDGGDDWVVRGGGAFNPGSLSDGVWYAYATLDTYPDNDFAGLTTVEVCFRNTSLGGNGAVFWINADWSGLTCASIVAFMQLQANNTQTLTVCHMLTEVTKVRFLTVPGLSTDFVTLRLLIDPGLNTVNVRVGGLDYGTFAYNALTLTGAGRFASLQASGSDAEFDYVSVRVGE